MTRTYFVLIVIICFITSCTNNKIKEIPVTVKTGFGPFKCNLNRATINRSEKIDSTLSGLPIKWKNLKTGAFETNGLQSIYQDYIQGNISEERFEWWQKNRNWHPDTLHYSKKPIKTKINFVFGKDSTGVEKIIIDTNNNLDFRDDKVYKPTDYTYYTNGNNIDLDSLAKNSSIDVTYERFIKNKIETTNCPLIFAYDSIFDEIYYSFPQYLVANLESKEIAISSENFRNFAYFFPNIVVLDGKVGNGVKTSNDSIFLPNQYIKIKDNYYQIIGSKLTQGFLDLKKQI